MVMKTCWLSITGTVSDPSKQPLLRPEELNADQHGLPGPIMRIAPNELSVNDIDVYHKVIYTQNAKFPKAPYFYDAFNQPGGSLFSETNS
jgi:hypothetical protein